MRTHRYVVETGRLAQLLEQRTRLLQQVRSNPAFTEAVLIRQSDGSYLDIWRWESAEAMRDAPTNFAPPGATLVLTTDHSVLDGEVLDER